MIFIYGLVLFWKFMVVDGWMVIIAKWAWLVGEFMSIRWKLIMIANLFDGNQLHYIPFSMTGLCLLYGFVRLQKRVGIY